MKKSVRIANAGGFWGDWLGAPKQQVLFGNINYLTLDYLAELTMSLLARQKEMYPDRGFVFDFVKTIEELLPELIKQDVRVISNAGGMNPLGCGKLVRAAAEKLGLAVRVAVITGDDITKQLSENETAFPPLNNLETGENFSAIAERVRSANVYLGSDQIAEALHAGADIVITGRVSDAALTLGPLKYEFGWADNDWNALALGAVVGHTLECGAQATGGNFSGGEKFEQWSNLNDPANIGFPIAEVFDDMTAIITKAKGTGGLVTEATVKEQLLYEIGDPKKYLTPDVVVDFTSIKLKTVGENEVQISGVKGSHNPESLKVSISYFAGYAAEGTLFFCWPEAVKKAEAADRIIRQRLDKLSLKFEKITTELIGYHATHGIHTNCDPDSVPEVLLRIAVRGEDKRAVERFIRELPPLVLSGPPGISGYAGNRPGARELFAYWPALIPRDFVIPEIEFI